MKTLVEAPVSPAVSLWDLFESKAIALAASVVHSPDESAAAGTVLHNPPDEVVCRADFAVAETGSLLVNLSNADRSAALLANRLWLVVQAEDIVATLDEALERVGDRIGSGSHYATFMSGPSRTADIERTLTIGVHGPGALAIVIVGQPA